SLSRGQMFWYWIVSGGDIEVADERPPHLFGMSETAWRFASLIWLLGIGVILLVGFLGTLRTYRMTPDEARMVGQDVIWVETRGEQRRITRWTAWARRKWFRKTGQQP